MSNYPEGYNNATAGNSGNITVNGTYTYSPESNGDTPVVSRRSLLPDTLERRDGTGDVTTFAYQNETHRYLLK